MLSASTAGRSKTDDAPQERPLPLSLRLAVHVVYGLFIFCAVANIIVTAVAVTGFVFYHQPFDGDFPMFYAAADNIISNSDNLYEADAIEESISKAYGFHGLAIPEYISGWFRYYNPPFYLLMLAPLRLLDIHSAYMVSVVINLAALAGLIWLAGVALRWRQPLTLLVAAGTLGLQPAYSAIVHGQPSIFIALLVLGAFLAAERRKTAVASLLLALATAKPQWFVLPSLALLRENWRALLPLTVLSGVVVLGPFLFLGVGVLLDYISLVTDRTGVDLNDARYSAVLHNWVGFFRALAGSPQPTVSLVFSLLTLGILVPVFLRRDRELMWAAAIFATVIATPHVHSHEWLLIVPASAFLLRRPMAPHALAVTALLLLAVHSGTTAAVIADGSVMENNVRFVYWSVPAAFLMVVWCAVLPVLEERRPLLVRGHGTMPAAAP